MVDKKFTIRHDFFNYPNEIMGLFLKKK